MKDYKEKHPYICVIVQKRIDAHFEQPNRGRRYEILRDPLFLEGLLDHVVAVNDAGEPFIACAECWQRYHDLLANARDAENATL